MIGKAPDKNQKYLYDTELKGLLDPRQPLYKLADEIPWGELENTLKEFYSDKGRPAKHVRMMTALLILKQLYNLSDEKVVEQWTQNPYFQYFSGEIIFQWKIPVEPSDIPHFRKRIGEAGVEKIFQISIKIHKEDALEKEVVVDTTVQEKNITFPTDVKLQTKIIKKCIKIAKEANIELRQTYTRTLKKLIQSQRFRNHAKNYKKAYKAAKKIKTIAGRLVRELERKLPENVKYLHNNELEMFKKVLNQKKDDKDKIYSLHEPQVYCIAKGKEHKKYEFGCKVGIALTKTTGIIVGSLSFKENTYDGHTLKPILKQTEILTGKRPEAAIMDRGGRGIKNIDGTEIITPELLPKNATTYEKRKIRERFRRRAGIEPVIGHIKQDFRMARNFLKGELGDSINALMAAAGFNFNKWMKKIKARSRFIFALLYKWFEIQILSPNLAICYKK